MMKVLLCVFGLVVFSRGSSGEAVSFSLNDAVPSSAGRSSILAPSCKIPLRASLYQKKITGDFGYVLEGGGQAAEDVGDDDDDSVVLASTFNSQLPESGAAAVKFNSEMPSNAKPPAGIGGGVAGAGGAVNTDYIPDFAPYPYPGLIFPGYCPSVRRTIQPTWAINSQGKWVRLFQTYYFRQRFPVVYCTSAYCSSFYAYPLGHDDAVIGGPAIHPFPPYYYPIGQCYVKYRYFFALVIKGCGGGYGYWGGLNLEVQLIRLPGSCTCRNTFLWPPY